MVQVIKRSESKESAKKKLNKKKKSEKGFDAHKYCGIINWDIDPIEYQREARRDRFEPSR